MCRRWEREDGREAEKRVGRWEIRGEKRRKERNGMEFAVYAP